MCPTQATLTTYWFNIILTYHCKVTKTVPRGRLCSQTVGRRRAAEDRPSHHCVMGGWSGAACAAARRTGRCQRQGKDGWSASPSTCCCAGCGSGPTGSPGTGDIQVSLQVFRSQYKNGPAVCVCVRVCVHMLGNKWMCILSNFIYIQSVCVCVCVYAY